MKTTIAMRKAKEKTIAKLKADVQTVFNAFIRQRDSQGDSFVCISCGKKLPLNKMQSGHFFNTKGYNHLRYNEDNANGECSGCNGFKESHLIWYSINLKDKIGDDRFAALLNESLEKKKEFTRTELQQIKSKYKALLKDKP